ncbi:MAG TPA: nicotinate-nucleotide adenylyltransferase [bacterium]
MKIGFFGGTFDPVHIGHLLVAETVRSDFGLDRVVFIPACIQPFKPDGAVADARSRLRMVELALKGHPSLEVSDIEIRRGGVSYTVDTLKALRQSTAESADDFFWIVGMDGLIEMNRWKRAEDLLELATVLVASRPGFDEAQADALIRARAVQVETPPIGISSSQIRSRVRLGTSIRFWVPDAVERFIMREGLYR